MPTAAPMHRSRSERRAKPKKHNWNHGRKTTSQRGYGAAWQKLRRMVLKRDKHLCLPCLQQGKYTQAAEVDHILSKARGGTDDANNLQSICKPCHKAKTEAERHKK